MLKRRSFGLVDPKKEPKIVAIIFLIVGLIMVPIGSQLSAYQARHIAESISVQVEVIRIDSRKAKRRSNESVSRRRQLQFRPVFQTTIPTGERITYESNSWSSPAAYDVGDHTTGYYNARTGAINTDHTISNQSLAVKIVTFLGAAFIAFGFILLLILRTRKKHADI